MKGHIAFLFFGWLFLPSTLLAYNAIWSDDFHFNGGQITEEAIVLNPTDPLPYSSAMAEGTPVSLTILATDKNDTNIVAEVFSSQPNQFVEGFIFWDYTADEFKYLPADDTYLLAEVIKSDSEVKTFERNVTILPEPATLFLLGSFVLLYVCRRMKFLAMMAIFLAFGALGLCAETEVTKVSCMQMWPFDRSVIINYNIASDSVDPIFKVSFYGSTSSGQVAFNLLDYGTISGEGATGIVTGSGEHKTFWTPSDYFNSWIRDNFKIKVEAIEQSTNLYMVIDISGGTNAASFAVSYLDRVPEGGWTDEYKTTKMVLRRIEAGKFYMGSLEREYGRSDDETMHEVTLTKPFYIGVFETTKRQYSLITGSNLSDNRNMTHPVDYVSYHMIRGSRKGMHWPESNEVDEDSFFGILRKKTNMDFDLPTEAQWEYACRSNTTSAFNDGSSLRGNIYISGNLSKLGCYAYNSNGDTVKVGSYRPNVWGLYDMHGNVREWCLDYYGEYKGDEVDPKGASSANFIRITRGGHCIDYAYACRSANRGFITGSQSDACTGFRVVLIPE